MADDSPGAIQSGPRYAPNEAAELLRDNPFLPLKAEEIAENETIYEWFETPKSFANLTARHEAVVGGRGSGKTMLLRYLSFAVQRARESRPGRGELLPLGEYFDFRRLFQEAEGPTDGREVRRRFHELLPLFLCRGLLDLTTAAADSGVLKTESPELVIAGLQTHLDVCGLAGLGAAELNYMLTDRIRRIAFRDRGSGTSVVAPGLGLVHDLCAGISSCLIDGRPKTILLLLDQVDELLPSEQTTLNMLLRNPAPRSYRVKLGLRPRGWRTKSVPAQTPLRHEHDYWLVDLEHRGEGEAYSGLLRRLAARRLRLWARSCPESQRWLAGRIGEEVEEILGPHFDPFVELSSGIVHQFLLLCRHSFDVIAQRPASKSRKRLSLTQEEGERVAQEVAHAYYKESLSCMKQSTLPAAGQRASGLIRAASSAVNLAAPKIPNGDFGHSFAIGNPMRLTRENLEVIELAMLESLLQEPIVEAAGVGEGEDDALRFRINELIALVRGFPSTMRGLYSLDADQLEDEMTPHFHGKSSRNGQIELFEDVPGVQGAGSGASDLEPSGEQEAGLLGGGYDLPSRNRQDLLQEFRHRCNDLGHVEPEQILEGARYSATVLDRVTSEARAAIVAANPDFLTDLANTTVVVGGSLGRFEAQPHVSDADFFLLVEAPELDENATIGRSVAFLFNAFVSSFRHADVRVEFDGVASPSDTFGMWEARKFPKITRLGFLTETVARPEEPSEALTLRMAMLSEGASVFHAGVCNRAWSKLLDIYRFRECPDSNSFPEVFLNHLSTWTADMWDRLYLRDQYGELTARKLDCHRLFLHYATLLALGAHVSRHVGEVFGSQHKLLFLPPALRLLGISSSIPNATDAEREAIRKSIRDVLIAYNDSQLALRQPSLREYWKSTGKARLELEQSDLAALARRTRTLDGKLSALRDQLARLTELVLPQLPTVTRDVLEPHIRRIRR